MMKRGCCGKYHKMSPKHLNRYVKNFEGLHNIRDLDSVEQMGGVVAGMEGKRQKSKTLIRSNGLSSAATAA